MSTTQKTGPNPFDKQTTIPGIGQIILVGSGKGGVGKSTVAANLALALKEKGRRVGILDADIYGPSIPRIFGAINQVPPISPEGKIQPIVRHGVKIMSIGFLVDESSAVVWRGPMMFKALDQFLRDVQWGELDDLIIDLPPGTGDVPLTIAQKVAVKGAIVVCTPQNLALIDAKKAVDMFDQVNIPLLGIVENMSYMLAPGGSGERIQLFPKGDLNSFLDAKKIPKLSEIPFNPMVGVATEAGMPIVVSNPASVEAKAFAALAERVIEETK